MILNKGVRYEERGPAVCEQSKRVRISRMIRTLRKLGYRVELQADPPTEPVFIRRCGAARRVKLIPSDCDS
jgi:hypothetical protein